MVEQKQKLTGRPRDPEIRQRVLLAAQRVYVRAGFSGFTFEAVAREAAVGKPAIYRRWASAEALMDDVLSSHALVPDRSSQGDIGRVLWAIAMSVLRLTHSEEGAFILRVSSERGLHPELFDHRGRLKQRALTKLLIEQAGKTILKKVDLVEYLERTDGAPRTAHAWSAGPLIAPASSPARKRAGYEYQAP